MTDFLKPVFTMVKNEQPEAPYRRIDTYAIKDRKSNEVEGAKVKYHWEQSKDSLLEENGPSIEDLEGIQPREFSVSYDIEVQDLREYNESLKAWGLDRDPGRNEINGEDSYERVYRVEFFDPEGMWENVARWIGTVPDERIFGEVFSELEAQAREIVDDHSGL